MQVLLNSRPSSLTFFAQEESGVQTKVHLDTGVTIVEDDAWLRVQEQPVVQQHITDGVINDLGVSVSSAADALLEIKGGAAERVARECYDAKLAEMWIARERNAKSPRQSVLGILEKRHAELTKVNTGSAKA